MIYLTITRKTSVVVSVLRERSGVSLQHQEGETETQGQEDNLHLQFGSENSDWTTNVNVF